MADKIYLDIDIDDNGTFKKVAVDAKKLDKALGGAERGARNADRNLKGASRQSSNATKNFSKMAQGMTGLVPIYATLAANVFAVSAAFSYFKNAADLRVLQEGQELYANKTGKSLSLLTFRIQQATDGVLDFQRAASSVSIGTAAGVSSDQLTRLAGVARNASMALGRDMADSYDRLIRGATKAEPELLDELGIILRLEDATERYATSIGKTRQELTAYQRTQAVVNDILRQGEQKFTDLNGSVNQFNKLGKTFKDLLNNISEVLSPIAEMIAGGMAENALAVSSAFGLLGGSIVKSLRPVGFTYKELAAQGEAAAETLSKYANTASKTGKALKELEPLTDGQLDKLGKTFGAKNSSILSFDAGPGTDKLKAQFEEARSAYISLRSEQQLHLAENTKGIKSTFALWKSQLYAMQAQYGRFWGTVNAMTVAGSKALSRALTFVGTIGALVALYNIIDSFMDRFRDKSVIEFENRMDQLTDALEKQNLAVIAIKQNWTEAATAASSLSREANLLGNISYSNIKGLLLDTSAGTTVSAFDGEGSGSATENSQVLSEAGEANREKLASFIPKLQESLALEIATLDSLGENSQELQEIRNSLLATFGELDTAYSRFDQFDRIPELTKRLNQQLMRIPAASENARNAVTNQANALKHLGQVMDEYREAHKKMLQTSTRFDTLLKVYDETAKSLNTLIESGKGLNTIADLDPGQASNLKELLKGAIDDTTSLAKVRDMLNQQVIDTRKEEEAKFLKGINLETKYTKLLSKSTPFIRERLELKKQEETIDNSINNALYEMDYLENRLNDTTSTRYKRLEANLALYKAQKEEVAGLLNDTKVLADETKAAFETNFSDGLSSLIKNEESSLKDAVYTLAENTLKASADVLSKQLTRKAMQSIFGIDEESTKMRQALKDGASKIYDSLVQGGQAAADAIRGAASGAARGVKGVASQVGGGFRAAGKYMIGGVTEEAASAAPGVSNPARTGAFGPFVDSLERLFSHDSPFLERMWDVFASGAEGFDKIFGDLLSGVLGQGFGQSDGLVSMIAGMFGAGFSTGGVAEGSKSGHLAMLHGTEAVVPLPNNKSIPVDLGGAAGQQNNVTVNVSVANDGTATSDAGGQGANLGNAIAVAVQKELQNQKRSGGILNPYGAA